MRASSPITLYHRYLELVLGTVGGPCFYLPADRGLSELSVLTPLVVGGDYTTVPLPLLRHFCGVCVSLTLALPLAPFYTRSVYFDVASAEREERKKIPRVARRASEASRRVTNVDLVAAYSRRHDSKRAVASTRIGSSAGLVRRVVEVGIGCALAVDVGHCSKVVFAFLFECLSTSIRFVRSQDVSIDSDGVSMVFMKRKGKALYRLLQPRYPCSPKWDACNLVALLRKWAILRLQSAGFFDTVRSTTIGTADLAASMRRVLLLTGKVSPQGFCYGSHSARIGGLNELFVLGFSRE